MSRSNGDQQRHGTLHARSGVVDVGPRIHKRLHHGAHRGRRGLGAEGDKAKWCVHIGFVFVVAAIVAEALILAAVVVVVVPRPLPLATAHAIYLHATLAPDRGDPATWADLCFPGLLCLQPLLAIDPPVPRGDLAPEAKPLSAARRPLPWEAMHPRKLHCEPPLAVLDPQRVAGRTEDPAQLRWRRPATALPSAVLLEEELDEGFRRVLPQEAPGPCRQNSLTDLQITGGERVLGAGRRGRRRREKRAGFVARSTPEGQQRFSVLDVLRGQLIRHQRGPSLRAKTAVARGTLDTWRGIETANDHCLGMLAQAIQAIPAFSAVYAATMTKLIRWKVLQADAAPSVARRSLDEQAVRIVHAYAANGVDGQETGKQRRIEVIDHRSSFLVNRRLLDGAHFPGGEGLLRWPVASRPVCTALLRGRPVAGRDRRLLRLSRAFVLRSLLCADLCRRGRVRQRLRQDAAPRAAAGASPVRDRGQHRRRRRRERRLRRRRGIHERRQSDAARWMGLGVGGEAGAAAPTGRHRVPAAGPTRRRLPQLIGGRGDVPGAA
mmetsp:Transcript_125068/g.361798  ORF Transcript_125068/g.361798 Transcript_125068/m.361798 type:complete len:549 (-) Transcript_125068:10-1656(-)